MCSVPFGDYKVELRKGGKNGEETYHMADICITFWGVSVFAFPLGEYMVLSRVS